MPPHGDTGDYVHINVSFHGVIESGYGGRSKVLIDLTYHVPDGTFCLAMIILITHLCAMR